MGFRLKTSKQTMLILKDLQAATRLTPNILARIAIGLSLRDPESVEEYPTDNHGLEFNRHTLTGEHDCLFKMLMAQHCGRKLSDEEYFPGYIKLHLDRGIEYLANEYKYAGNYQRLVANLLRLDSRAVKL